MAAGDDMTEERRCQELGRDPFFPLNAEGFSLAQFQVQVWHGTCVCDHVDHSSHIWPVEFCPI